jgi:hypothetical protein
VIQKAGLQSAIRIRDILVRIRIRGSVPLTQDPDPTQDPALFVSELQDANKKLFFSPFFAYYFWKVHLRHSLKIKSHTEVTKK